MQSAANKRIDIGPEDRTGDGKVDCDDYFVMMSFGLWGNQIVPPEKLTEIYGWKYYKRCKDIMISRGLPI